MQIVNITNTVASIGSIALFLFTITVLLAIESRGKFHEKMKVFVTKKIAFIGVFVTLGSILLSLVYSNIIGYPPCNLCWYARILLYPQLIIFLMFFSQKHDKKTLLSVSTNLSIIGLVITTYHSLITYIGGSPLPCDAVVSCTQRFVYQYGFVTIPLMACIAFATLVICNFYAKKNIQNI